MDRNKDKNKFKLKRKEFINWLISDLEDIEYFGNRLRKELIETGSCTITAEELFNERDSIPGFLLEDQMTSNEIYEGLDTQEVPIEEVKLI